MAHYDRNQGFAFVYVDINKLLLSHIKTPTDTSRAVTQIKENLDRLQTLHHKLHDMIHELNQNTTATKKKRKKENKHV